MYISPITICILVYPGLIKTLEQLDIDVKKLDVDLRIVFMIYLVLYWLATHEIRHYEVNRKDRGT